MKKLIFKERIHMAKENVLIVYFNVESEGYQAFSELSHDTFSKDDKSTLIEQASLIKRENGNIIEKDAFHQEIHRNEGIVIGTIAGSLLGILGGPLGVLLGMGVGATIGSLASFDDEENEGLLQSVSTRLQDNDVAILAVVQEDDETLLDNYFAKFDTTIVRYDAHVIEEEIEYAEELQKELARQARAQMKEERSEERKRKVEEKRSQIKARFAALKDKLKS